jgi:hypothetical protein
MTDDMRAALRQAMSELSEQAHGAGWHFDTGYALWQILIGARVAWMRLGGDDSPLAELRRLHEAVGGWWRWNAEPDGGWGDTEFVTTATWQDIDARTVDGNGSFRFLGGALRTRASEIPSNDPASSAQTTPLHDVIHSTHRLHRLSDAHSHSIVPGGLLVTS